MEAQYDWLVIGGGSGGVRAARIAAECGAHTALIEGYRMGGTCVIRGCVPKKLYVMASQFPDAFAEASGFGWSLPTVHFDWPTLVRAKEKEITRLSRLYADRLHKAGVDILAGFASFVDAHTLQIGDRHLSARHILIATGGHPVRPGWPGAELALTSNEIFDIPTLPRKLLIIGGGYIAVEFASLFNGLGCEVTLSYRRNTILRGFDHDVRRHTQEQIRSRGVRILLNSQLNQLQLTSKQDTGHFRAHFQDGTSECFDLVLMATGRHPDIGGLALDKAGVAVEQGAIVVDENFATSTPHIYAVGDVIGGVALTPVAIRQGAWLARHLFDAKKPAPYHRATIPSAVFCQPPIATVGLTEEAALEQYEAIDIYLTDFSPMRQSFSQRKEKTLVKLIVCHSDQRVLGIHMVGPDAPEIIQGFAVAISLQARKADLDNTLGIHPTAAEELVTMRSPTTRRASGG